MTNLTLLTDLTAALRTMRPSAVTQWNRIEGRPRTRQFDRALRAEVRDPLWMLSRQWQLGEFNGDDAGSPVLAQLRMGHTRLTKIKLGEDPVEPMADPLPLEARVERLATPLTRGATKIGFDLRLLMGRHWLKTIATIGNFAAAYRNIYPIDRPDPTAAADVDVCAHPRSFAMLAAVAGRAMDGGELYSHVKSGGAASDGIGAAGPAATTLDAAGVRFVTWFERLISQPPDGHDGAWTPERLEYQFEATAPRADATAKVYVATKYADARLDWYGLDVDTTRTSIEDPPAAEDTSVLGSQMRTVIPSPLQFDGMPNARWWAFEDGRVNFGAVGTATTDLGKLVFLEFALVYSNDWMLAPITAPAGTIATLTGCAVTNTFGERFWIRPAAEGLDDDPRRFTLFTSSVLGDSRQPADPSLLLLPRALHVLDGSAIEEVVLLRDEMANLVWGVEKRVPLPDGSSVPGGEAAAETLAYYERLLAAAGGGPGADPDPVADIRYRVMNTVPENWIPLIPAQLPGGDRAIRLQRGALPRVLEGDTHPPVRVQPLTSLLRDGLDGPAVRPYFLEEAEVPREGVHVVKHFQRTRWLDGRVVVWLGARKQVGRGQGSSGLAFDRAVPSQPPTPL